MAAIRSFSPRQALAGIGARLQQLRVARRISQHDLALAAGISARTLRRLEAAGDARLETLVRVAFALRIESQLDALFAVEETRSLDEILDMQRKPKRVRKTVRP
ncbi:MAG: helix-turn-helix transcriptional regulator [bacterium]|nr:helix-turn-helix transcriptional regulator [bacterium]